MVRPAFRPSSRLAVGFLLLAATAMADTATDYQLVLLVSPVDAEGLLAGVGARDVAPTYRVLEIFRGDPGGEMVTVAHRALDAAQRRILRASPRVIVLADPAAGGWAGPMPLRATPTAVDAFRKWSAPPDVRPEREVGEVIAEVASDVSYAPRGANPPEPSASGAATSASDGAGVRVDAAPAAVERAPVPAPARAEAAPDPVDAPPVIERMPPRDGAVAAPTLLPPPPEPRADLAPTPETPPPVDETERVGAREWTAARSEDGESTPPIGDPFQARSEGSVPWVVMDAVRVSADGMVDLLEPAPGPASGPAFGPASAALPSPADSVGASDACERLDGEARLAVVGQRGEAPLMYDPVLVPRDGLALPPPPPTTHLGPPLAERHDLRRTRRVPSARPSAGSPSEAAPLPTTETTAVSSRAPTQH